MAALRTSSDAGEYSVRPYTPADLEDILSLYERVFGKSRSREWFEWRYDSPYLDGPQAIVAEHAGTVVGAEPFIAFRFATGEGTEIAVQPADAMVHPDHRRRGVLTRMTEFALDHYTPREPAFVFNFPNRQAVDAYRKLGWRTVPGMSSAFRVQNPGRFVGVGDHPVLQRTVELVGRTAARGIYALLDRHERSDAVTVDRATTLPAATLADLYEQDVPDALHAQRDAAFFEWRLGNPEWSTATYVARQGDEPVAAMVAVTESNNDCTFTKVMEALPMGGSAVDGAMARLLAAVCRDHRGSDVVKMAHGTVPDSLAGAFGFRRGDRPPLEWLTTPSTMVVRPLDPDGDDWTVGERRLTARDDWRITYSEQDTAY